MDIFSNHYDQFIPEPSKPPKEACQYHLAPCALENAMLRALASAPTKPVIKKMTRPSKVQNSASTQRHARIREEIVAAVVGQWLSIDQIAEAISEDREVVQLKMSRMVAAGLLNARGNGYTRRFTKGKNPKKKPARKVPVADRRKAISAAITSPMKINEIMQATGLDRHTLQADLSWLTQNSIISIERNKVGVSSIYSPAAQEAGH